VNPNGTVFVPSRGVSSWQERLADPAGHWRTGFSARAMAHAWEAASGWPPEIAVLLDAACGPCQPLMVLPEWQTALPGGRRNSQSDALLIASRGDGLIVAAIEGKVDESFGPTVADWLTEASAGKATRLAFLCERLGLSGETGDLHYQLLHRTASALIEAERFHATYAAMIVHSFSPERRWFDAFSRFVERLGGVADVGVPIAVNVPGAMPLVMGWACGDQRLLTA
jgi:hypothetical protein